MRELCGLAIWAVSATFLACRAETEAPKPTWVVNTEPDNPTVRRCKLEFPVAKGLGPELDSDAVWQKCMTLLPGNGLNCDPALLLSADAAGCIAKADGMATELHWRATLRMLHGPPPRIVWSISRPDNSELRIVHAHTGAIIPLPARTAVSPTQEEAIDGIE